VAAMPAATKVWTLEELHSLPDDGNKYELIHGVLYMTPGPTDQHETIAARLTRLLDPYVAKHGLGYVYHPRAVFNIDGSEVEPDLMVRRPNTSPGGKWANAPRPSLIVEIASPSTRRRDRTDKRDFYLEYHIPDYWIVDGDARTITVVRPDRPDVVEREAVRWEPDGASEPFVAQCVDIFGPDTAA
jgi:Uma2 family endonuclease